MSVAEIWQNIQPQYLPSQSLGFSSIGTYDAPERVPEDCIRRSWILIKPGYEIIVRSADIPHDLYNAPAQRCRRLFADLIHQWYHITVDEDEIQFFVPKAPLFSSHFGHPAWRMIPMGDLPSNPDFTQVPLDVSLSDALVAKPSVGQQGINIVVNVVFECPEFMRYRKTLMDPSLAPQPDKVAPTGQHHQYDAQAKPTEAIFNGRRASAAAPHPAITADPDPPPIHLFNPVFDAFTHYLLNPDMQPTASDIQDVYELMCCLSVTTGVPGVGVDPDMSFEREQDVQRRLAHILAIGISENPDSAGTGAGGIVIGQTPIPFLIFQRTSELADGDYDPTTQAGLVMGRSWTGADSIKARIRDDCCCPTFMITGGGPWLSILGGIFTDRVIVQRLTELRWMAISSPDEDSSVYHNARILIALRISLSWLAGYYTRLAELTTLHLRPYSPSRFFPCVSCFRVGDDGTIVDFRYLRRLDQHTGFTYLAEMEDDPRAKLVVKFVKKYGKDVHEFLALHNHAPALLHCGHVSGSSTPGAIEFNSGLGRNAPPGLFLDEGMTMVVMEYISSRPPLTLENGKGPMDAQVLDQVYGILRLLHSNGFVFGKLRPPNILVTETGIVKLIGFNWSGRFDMGVRCCDPPESESLPDGLQDEIEAAHLLRVDGAPETPYAYYPLGMSSVYGLWDPGMCPLKPIRPRHDWVMYSKLSSEL